MSQSIVQRLRQASKKLKKAAVWNGTDLAVDATKDDYIFELLCYFGAALHAQSDFSIEVTGNIETVSPKSCKAKWPKKPGNKENFSYLSLKDKVGGNERYQLCPGINIEDMHGKGRAPDINLLNKDVGDHPKHTDLLACWDAKYTSREDTRLPDTAVSDFIYTFKQLGSPTQKTPWSKSTGDKVFAQSGLITNGQESTEPVKALLCHGISETNNFPIAPQTRPKTP